MQPDNRPNLPKNAMIPDGDWMMIHCDTFISERDRLLQREQAFLLDRDYASAATHLPNFTIPGDRTTAY